MVANVDAQPYPQAVDVPDRLVRQVSQLVRWQDCVLTLADMGIERFVEVGPGKVLLGLVRRIVSGASLGNVEDPASLEALAGET